MGCRGIRELAGLAFALATVTTAPADAGAASSAAANLAEREHLGGDWLGLRTDLGDLGIDLQAVYTGDVVANVRGGVRRRAVYLGNLDLEATCHLPELTGLELGTLFVYALVDHGGSPSKNVGDLQIVDNIEAPAAVKLYEAWWQGTFFSERVSLLVGLYDLNSEFYTLHSADLFLNSSFGIGPELASSGRNGPSIFPTTAFGGRVKAELFPGLFLKTAVLDGVPGDPDSSGATRIRFADGDGVFFAAELSLVVDAATDGVGAQPMNARWRQIARGGGQTDYRFKAALGTWLYTSRLPRLDATAVDGRTARKRGHPGAYLIADYDITPLDPLGSQGLSVFLQLGFADGDVGPFAGYAGGGLSYLGLLPRRPDDHLGLAVAAGVFGDGFKEELRRAGETAQGNEVATELTYRLQLTPWLGLQGDLQYVASPGGQKGIDDALVVGLRYEINF